MNGFPCPECQAIMPQGSQQCWRCGWDVRGKERRIFFGVKKRLLLVFNVSSIVREQIEERMKAFMEESGDLVYVIPSMDGPPISIWDLDNIQNGDPIPPMVINKLKEMVNNASI